LIRSRTRLTPNNPFAPVTKTFMLPIVSCVDQTKVLLFSVRFFAQFDKLIMHFFLSDANVLPAI
jgi:hypothetical protein